MKASLFLPFLLSHSLSLSFLSFLETAIGTARSVESNYFIQYTSDVCFEAPQGRPEGYESGPVKVVFNGQSFVWHWTNIFIQAKEACVHWAGDVSFHHFVINVSLLQCWSQLFGFFEGKGRCSGPEQFQRAPLLSPVNFFTCSSSIS